MEFHCRLCAQLKHIHDLNYNLDDVRSKLKECFDWVESSAEKDFPQNVCRTCFFQLNQSWHFINVVKNAQKEIKLIVARLQQASINPLEYKTVEEEAKYELESEICDELDASNDEEYLSSTEFESTKEDGDDNNSSDSKMVSNSIAGCPIETESVEMSQNPKRFLKKQEFLCLIPKTAQLDNGEIHPDKIVELNLVDWSAIKYFCWLCSICCDTQELLQKHFEEKHPNDEIKWMCPLCIVNKRDPFKTISGLNLHIVSQHYPHLCYCCSKCNIYFWDKKQMKKHWFRVPHAFRTAEPIACPVCGKTFLNRQSWRNHIRLHRKQDRQFQCYLCRKSLRNVKSLKAHVNLLHVNARKKEPHVCSICAKICQSLAALYGHMKTHDTVKAFTCDICQKSFKERSSLRKHQDVHITEKKLFCNECEYRCHRPYMLLLHQRKHSNVRLYECDFCSKKFKLSNGLKVHRRLHTGEKPYKCMFCDYESTNVGNISKHERRRHNTEKIAFTDT